MWATHAKVHKIHTLQPYYEYPRFIRKGSTKHPALEKKTNKLHTTSQSKYKQLKVAS